jgi:predicted lipoprotein with Yx(FWY)xxD motif
LERPVPARPKPPAHLPAGLRERPHQAAGAAAAGGRRRFPKRRLAGIVAAATAFTVAGGVLSAQAARQDAPDTVTAPPSIPDAAPDPVAPTLVPPVGTEGGAGDGVAVDGGSTGTPDDRPRPPPRAALVAHRTSRLGPVVVDAEGFTLYRFDGDSAGDATCTDACATTWPPATVDPDARLALEGVDTSKVGLIRRRDGTYQLTISSWPVYRFAGDSRPDTFTGHGIGDQWFAITPTGAKAIPP